MKKTFAILIICIIAISLTLGCAGLNNPYDPELTGEWEHSQGGITATWDFDGFGNFIGGTNDGETYYGTYTTNANTLTINATSNSNIQTQIMTYEINGNELKVTPVGQGAPTITFYRKGTQPSFDPELTGKWAFNSAAGLMEYYFDGTGNMTLRVISGNHIIEEGTYTANDGILKTNVINHTTSQNNQHTIDYSIDSDELYLIFETGAELICRRSEIETAKLTLHVNNAETGLPITNALVTIVGGQRKATDASGTAVFIMPKGYYEIDVSADGYQSNPGIDVVLQGDMGLETLLDPVQTNFNGVYDLTPGETVLVTGMDEYEGQNLLIRLIDVNTDVPNGQAYPARWQLENNSGVALKRVERLPPRNLREEFWPYFKEYAVFEQAGIRVADNSKFATIRITTPLEIRTNQVFPYDSTQTTNLGWKAELASTTEGIDELMIYNNHSFIQSKTESSASKFMLAKGESLEIPLNLAELTYNGNLDFDTGRTSTIGQNELILRDPKSVERTIPYVISLSEGSNTIGIAGNSHFIAIDSNLNLVRHWKKSTANIADPWRNPNGVQNYDYFDTTLLDNGVTTQTIAFEIDSDLDLVQYVLGADKTTGQYWLFLKQQDFAVKNGILSFAGTSYAMPIESNTYLDFYLPDISTYNVLNITNSTIAPSEGDNIAFTAQWVVSETAKTEYIYIYQNTSTGQLIDPTDGKLRLMHMVNPINYTRPPVMFWKLNHTTTSDSLRLLKGITEYGIIVEIENNEAYFRIPTVNTVYTTTASKDGVNIDSLAQALDLIYNGASGAVIETYVNDSQFETLNYGGVVTLQTIADGFNPGNVLLSVPTYGIRYRIVFDELIRLGTDTGQIVDISGTNYRVVEATRTKLVLEPIN